MIKVKIDGMHENWQKVTCIDLNAGNQNSARFQAYQAGYMVALYEMRNAFKAPTYRRGTIDAIYDGICEKIRIAEAKQQRR